VNSLYPASVEKRSIMDNTKMFNPNKPIPKWFRFTLKKGALFNSETLQIVKLLVISPVTPLLLDPNILVSILSLCYSLYVKDQVLHPYKTTGKIMILCERCFLQFGR
jgi:hypothetical protein